ncbi:MAG: hypothetical protein JWO06_2736, partial [Bacteroidota bacterium]|nr:hypothetical protein [Bacteroidota bacterium]
MNLLFDFLKYLKKPDQVKIKALMLKGTQAEVWEQVQKQAKEGVFNKDLLLKELKISSSHFDKVTSELLAKCYVLLFGDDSIKLLHFLTNQIVYIKHFYSEMNRRSNQAKKTMSREEQALFYKKCMNLIQVGIPIIHRDEKVMKKLSEKYLALFKGEEKKHAALAVRCKLLLLKIDFLFAAGNISDEAKAIEKEIDDLGALIAGADEELVFDYHWTKIFYYHALEKFASAIKMVKEALLALSKTTGDLKDIHVLRFELKSAEFQYYIGQFDESYYNYHNLINTALFANIPDSGFQVTKYIQICLITERIEEAERIIEQRLGHLRDKLSDGIMPRDIFSFIKFYLFKGDYEEAFRFIQLGFEKNPKGKYFQYEIELRNLQTACLYLTGQEPTALDICRRSIKYLRNHGYGINNSDFPHFYILTEAIFKKKNGARPFTPKQEK